MLRATVFILFAFAIIAIISLLGIYTAKFGIVLSEQHAKWSEFGDFFGGTVGTVLSFISLIALLVTLYLQNLELRATRDELHETRKAQEAQARSLLDQVDIARNDAKSGVTFSMLERWSSPDMRHHRTAAWDFLMKNFGISDRPIPLLQIQQDEQTAYFGLMEVCQFISDINKMISLKRVDEQLTYTLFYNSLYPWFDFIPRMQLDARRTESRLPYDERVADWYKQWVFSLQQWFEKLTPHQPVGPIIE